MYGKDGRWHKTRRRSEGKKIETYRFLVRYIEKVGYPPTVQEVADEMQVSKSTAFTYLKALENAGLISRAEDKPRTIKIIDRNMMCL